MEKMTDPQSFTIPTGQELFDSIMAHIEPDLTSENLKTLDQKYAGETEDETWTRKQRYELAFERYEQAYSGYVETLQAQANRYRKQSIQKVELEHREKESGFLGTIEQAIFQAA